MKQIKMLLLASMVILFTACGGGGGSSVDTTILPDNPKDNILPTANAGSDQVTSIGETVTLDGSGSSDPDGDDLTYNWIISSQPNESEDVLNDNMMVNPFFTPTVEGSYTVDLVVNDGELNSAVDSVIIICEKPATEIGGIISTNTILTIDESPYLMTERIQLAENTTLTINPGVVLKSNDRNSMTIFGQLKIEGSNENHVILNNIDIYADGSSSVVDINYAEINDGWGFLGPLQHSGSSFILKNSIMNNAPIRFWDARDDIYIEKNTFINSFIDIIGADILILGSVYITNNVFDSGTLTNPIYTTPQIGIDIPTYSQMDLSIKYNTFLSTDSMILSLSQYSKGIVATENYWNTIDTDIIDNMIYDNNDDLSLNGSIEYTPFLTEPDPDTPVYNFQ